MPTRPTVAALGSATILLLVLNGLVLVTGRSAEPREQVEFTRPAVSSAPATTVTSVAVATTAQPPMTSPRTQVTPPNPPARAASTTTTTRPCQQPDRPPERAAPPDDRLCLTFTLTKSSAKRGEVVAGVLRAENQSNETVDLTRPTGCKVEWGLYINGKRQGGGRYLCGQAIEEDEMKPGEVREHVVKIETEDTPAATRTYDAFAGVNTMKGDLFAAPLPLTVE